MIPFIIALVLLSTLISNFKKKFFNECDHKLDPIVLGLLIEGSLTLLFGIICLFRYEESKKEIQYIAAHPKIYNLLIAIICTAAMTYIYYRVLTRVKLSSMSVFRSCLSIILGLLISFIMLKEKPTTNTLIGTVLIIAATYFIHKGTGKDFIE